MKFFKKKEGEVPEDEWERVKSFQVREGQTAERALYADSLREKRVARNRRAASLDDKEVSKVVSKSRASGGERILAGKATGQRA
jgi:hypothetical protein